MISVEKAKQLLEAFAPLQNQERKSVEESLGHVLATDIESPINMPPFPQSAMDGYALGGQNLSANTTFKVIGEVAAGSAARFKLSEGEAIRIFTGAPVPKTATAVVQQEWIEAHDDEIIIQKDVKPHMHIRPEGEQMRTGDNALANGTLITPATVGFLSMLGITHLDVFSKPRVAVLVTGDELVKPGQNLEHGQIFESNSSMLIAALNHEGINAFGQTVQDTLANTIERISEALESSDIIIVTGGISVGDHDYVGTALKQLGVDEVFYKVAQKPGKPLFFGTKGNKAVFALPGNPAASLTCFYEYVLPVLRKASGQISSSLEALQLPLKSGAINAIGRAQFLKARINDGQITILDGQSSAMLSSFSYANALVYVPSDTAKTAGDLVEVHLLP